MGQRFVKRLASVCVSFTGSEGAGVADVLLSGADGGVQFDFTGRLPMPWPNLDVNAGNRDLPVDDFILPWVLTFG